MLNISRFSVNWRGFFKTVIRGNPFFITVTTLLLIAVSNVSCHHATLETPPYIPSSYYTCLEVIPDDLVQAYFHINFGNVALADQNYKNMPILFKNVRVNEVMLRDKEKDVFYLSSIKCTPLIGGAVSSLAVGDMIDIIGINRGPWFEYSGWLSFTECLFLPGGSFPVSQGGSAFAPVY